jgi:hypothetical protein
MEHFEQVAVLPLFIFLFFLFLRLPETLRWLTFFAFESGNLFGICLKAAGRNQVTSQEEFESWKCWACLVPYSQVGFHKF